MLNKILDNLKNYPEDECYQIRNNIYKNKDLYKYICNIYKYIKDNCNLKDRVIVYGHKEIYMVASFLACSFAGITYIPIDISIPLERKNSIINQVNPKLIIDNSIESIMNNNVFKDIHDIYMQDDDIYYIIFTSGSTGEPKGVQITYNNLKSCMNWLLNICNINKDIVLNQANYSFDLSIADLYLPLLSRSKHYILEKEVQSDYSLLFNELKNSNAGIAIFTPSVVEYLLVDKSFNKNLLPNIKKIILCGERLNIKTIQELNNRFDYLQIINCYGPTECTFAVTSNIVDENEEVSIGIPKDDVNIYIVNNNLEEVPENEIGEILISGKSVGKGYLKEELNKDVFIEYNNENSYLTGDLGYKKQGKLYFIGRKDKQIKYNGYRIELLEIEKTINEIDFIEKSLVTVFEEENKVKRIIAFVKIKDLNDDNRNITIKDIKQILINKLPSYMIPTIKIIKTFPLTENGKIDEKLLLKEYYER